LSNRGAFRGVGLRGKLRRLERGAREDLASFILEDGSRYYYNPQSGECFLHACACTRTGYEGELFPEPPETVKALTRSRGRGAALNHLYPGGSFGVFLYEVEPLVQCGELVPHCKVTEEQAIAKRFGWRWLDCPTPEAQGFSGIITGPVLDVV
jgi:hypothetical protein